MRCKPIGAVSLVCCTLLVALLAGCAQLKSESDPVSHLLGLIGQRLTLADDVARSKWNSGAPVEDLAREKDIVDAISREAPAYGLEPALAGRFFRAQIDASKIVQNARLTAWRAEQRPGFVNNPDLQRDIRPQLDRLTPALLAALAQAVPALRAPGGAALLQARAAVLNRAETDGAALESAIAPLRHIADR